MACPERRRGRHRALTEGDDWPRDGAIVVSPDEYGVAQFRRRDGGEPLVKDEARLTYRDAKYGELRVAPDGTSLLPGLRDATLHQLGAR